MAVEDDPEEVVGLPLVPVGGRVDGEQRRDVRIGVRCGHLHLDAPVVGDRHQRVHRVQFAAVVLRVVHAADAQAQLEPQARVVAQRLRDRGQVLAAHLQRQLVAVHHHPLDRRLEGGLAERGDQRVDDLVEIAAVGRGELPGIATSRTSRP